MATPTGPIPPGPGISDIINEVEQVIEDALDGSTSLSADIVVLGGGLAGALLELGLVSSQTEAIALAAVTAGVPAIFRIIASIRHRAKAGAVAQVVSARISAGR